MTERIQKVLARAGITSRRQAEAWIRAGRISVNGRPASAGTQVGPRDKIALDGRAVRLTATGAAPSAALYHRPARSSLGRTEGGLSSELLAKLPGPARRRWIPLSPLPFNDSGLELLLCDGDLAHALMRRFAELRVQFALRIVGDPRLDRLERVRSGLLEDGTALKIESLELEGGEGLNRWFKLTVFGARARDVHRLCRAAGLQLSRLIRVSLGPLTMDRSLARGRVRPLESAETAALYEWASLSPPVDQRVRRASAKPRSRRGAARGKVTGSRGSGR